MSFLSPNGSSVSPDATFLTQAKETSLGKVLYENMRFSVYLHRGGVSGNFHDRIVIMNVKYGFVTLELSKDEIHGKIVPKCVQFQGEVAKLVLKVEVECTFASLAEEAITILRNMGEYSAFGNNCQNFCNYFLEVMEAPQYKTTARAAAEGTATGTGIVLVGGIVMALISLFRR